VCLVVFILCGIHNIDCYTYEDIIFDITLEAIFKVLLFNLFLTFKFYLS